MNKNNKTFSIKRIFVLVLFLFMLLPTCVVSFWMYRKISESWIQKEYENQANEIENVVRAVEVALEEYEDLIYSIYQMPDIMQNVKKAYREWSPQEHLEVIRAFNNVMNQDDLIKGAYLFLENGVEIYRDVLQMRDYYESLYYSNPQWETRIEEGNGKCVWLPTYKIQKKYNEYYQFSCASVLKDLNNIKNNYGIFVLNIDVGFFKEVFQYLVQTDDRTTYILTDEEGYIIWSNQMDLTEQLDPEFLQAVCKEELVSDVQEYQDEEYVVTAYTSSYNGWNYISMKQKTVVLESQDWVLMTIVIQIFLILLFAGIGAFILQHYIIRPIRKMVVVMSGSEKDILGENMEIERDDEIGRLYWGYNEMRQRIENYIHMLEENNRREKEYQIQALNAQINPHFIYNTLDTIHWMAMDIPALKISQLVVSLSDILRYSIGKKSPMVTLREELTCIRNYIMIYEERYETEFGCFEIDERVYPYRTLKMMLQPIVENCIVHGFASSMEHARIKVIAEIEGDDAVIRICDNGCGISRARIDYLLSRDSERVGLSNINQRLKLLYGEEHGLVIRSEPGQGTEVILRIPKRSMNEEGEQRDVENNNRR